MINLIISTMVAIVLPTAVFSIAWFLSMRQNTSNREKSSPFECGFDPNQTARIPFSLRFFLLAIIFVVFDIEIVLLIPIPLLSYSTPTTFIIMNSLIFLLILILGLVHEWNQGSLDWSN